MNNQSKMIPVPSKSDPNLIELAANAATQMAVAQSYIIDSRDMYEIATAQLGEIRSMEKSVETMRKSVADPLHTAWKNTNALFKPIAEKLDSAKRSLSQKLVRFEDEERAKVRAAEMAALAERQKAMAEANAKLAETEQAFEKGEVGADELQFAATEAMVVEASLPIRETAEALDRGGHARTTRWVVAEITDPAKLLRFLADKLDAGDVNFNNTVDFKLGQLNAFAQATSGSVQVPGVRFEQKSSIIART